MISLQKTLAIPLLLLIFCVTTSSTTFAKNDVIKAQPRPPQAHKCELYLGADFPIPGASLTYTLAGHEIIRHHFLQMVNNDTIAIATYLPVYKNNRITGYTSYIQYVNIDSRIVEYRSKSSEYGYPIGPGDLPVGQYTDLWIPKTTMYGDHVNIYATSTLVGMESDKLWYVGNQSPFTTYGTKSYSKYTGVFLVTNIPTPSDRLEGGIFVCAPQSSSN